MATQKQNKEWEKFLVKLSSWLDWLWLLSMTANIILIGIATEKTTYFPWNVLVLTILAVWFYHFEQKWLSLIAIGFSIYLQIMHL